MARILITGFCSIPSPGRPGVQMGHIVEGLHRQHEVDVLSVRRADQAHVERSDGTRYLRVPLPEGELSAQIEVFRRALRRQLEGVEYDVVHFRDGWSGVTALEVQRAQGYATVFDLARSPMAEPTLTDLATATELERAEETCVRRADVVLAPTEPSRQFLSGLTSASKIHVVPPGVNVDRFDWEDLNADRAPVVLYLGSLTAGRGVRVLLRAMLDVATVSNAILVLAGPATEAFTASLEDAVGSLGLDGRVHLLGEIPHELAPAVIARATVCVAPGAAELTPRPTALFPTKILEYMACRRAVVAPARGTVKMLFRDGEDCLLFKPGAPDDLAGKILLLLRDTKLRNRVAKGGYEMVRANCTASGTRRSLRRAYNWLAEQDTFRERLGQQDRGDQGLGTLTDLSLDLRVRKASNSETSEEYVDESLALDDEIAVTSPSVDPGEVTRVEAMRRQVPDPSEEEAIGKKVSKLVGDSDGFADEGTEEWEARLPVIEDTSSIDTAALKPKTVVTAPLDNSLVAGVVLGKAPAAELTKPMSERVVDDTAKTPAKALSKIPPANRAAKQAYRGPSEKAYLAGGSAEQDKTRVIAVADLEEIAVQDDSASPTANADTDESSMGLTRVVRGAIPRPPKLPMRRPQAANKRKSGTATRPPKTPSSPTDSSAKTQVVLSPLARPAKRPPRKTKPPVPGDPKSPPPDDLP